MTGRLGAQEADRGLWMIAVVGANPRETCLHVPVGRLGATLDL
jgi:hypothetical protein